MADIVERINGSVIQHGEYNNRIYLMKLARDGVPDTIAQLDALAQENAYTKIIAKVPERAKDDFERYGYKSEANIPMFYGGKERVLFMGKYFSDSRKVEENPDVVLDVLETALRKAGEGVSSQLSPEQTWSIAEERDAEEICRVYGEVFESYPFPIHDVNYILETMQDNVVYFVVRQGGKIISVASSEMDEDAQNVEMTDFATLPDYRGNSFAVFLLEKMEEAMRDRGIHIAYTIARAVSHGMNITFARLGYAYGGTLTNNTNICGNLESMNIWYKPLKACTASR